MVLYPVACIFSQSHLISKVIQNRPLTFALLEFSSVMQRRVATASPKHHLRSTSASSAHTFAAVACQCVVNLLPPEERESNAVRVNCHQCQRSETDVLWLWSTVLLTVSFTSWSHALFKLCCIDVLLLHPSVAPPHPCLSVSLSLVHLFSIVVSLSHSLRRFCSVAPCSDWFVVMGLTLSSPESGVALFLLFSCRSLHPAFPSILRWQHSLGCICQSLRRCFGFYLSTVSELHVFIHIWCHALWWKWIGVYWEKGTKRVWLCSKPSELPT